MRLHTRREYIRNSEQDHRIKFLLRSALKSLANLKIEAQETKILNCCGSMTLIYTLLSGMSRTFSHYIKEGGIGRSIDLLCRAELWPGKM